MSLQPVRFVLTGLVFAAALVSLAGSPVRAEFLVSDNFGSQVLRFDENSGAFLGTLVAPASGGLNGAVGMRFGPDGNLWVVSQGNNSILRYHPTSGAFIDVFASNGITLGANLNAPADLRFSPADGNLVVSNFGGASVDRFDAVSGASLGVFASGGGLSGASYALFGPDANLYVSSFNTNQVLRYNGRTGAFIDVFATDPQLSAPAGLAFHAGKLYAAALFGQKVLRFDGVSGAYVDVFAVPPPFGTFDPFPSDVMFRPSGDLLVALAGQQGVAAFDGATGTQLPFFATGGGLQVPGQMLFVPPAPHVWDENADGDWSPAGNWIGGSPNAAGAAAVFGSGITAPRTVTLDAAKTVGGIEFDNGQSYTLAGVHPLTIDNRGDPTTIAVKSGAHEISAPLSIAANNAVLKTGPGTLTLSGPQAHAPGAILTVARGTLNLNSNSGTPSTGSAAVANLTVYANGGRLNINASQDLHALDADETFNRAVIQFPSDAANQVRIYAAGVAAGAVVDQTTIDQVWLDIATGYNGGAWDGNGIGTTTISNSNVNGLGLVLEVDANGAQYLGIREMILGDVNGDDFVDAGDAGVLFASLGSGDNWLDGDLNYDLFVDASDAGIVFAALGQTFDPTFSPAVVPEPATILLGAIGGISLLVLGRRSRKS